MEVLHLSHSDIDGGAARAAYRIHQALRTSGVESRMLVNVASSGDSTVQGPSGRWRKAATRLRPHLVAPLRSALHTENPILHSPAVVPSNWVSHVNNSSADIIHLHWVGSEMLSIADIGRIRKPIVWTLHDMWPFCGAEHYTDDARWREGYHRHNRPSGDSGFDLNRWTWERKRKHWQRSMHIVTPSQWLGECARESVLMHDWPVSVIPYPIDTSQWRPIAKEVAREILGLPEDYPLVLFGAAGLASDPRKGFDLLVESLRVLRSDLDTVELVVFGQLPPRELREINIPVHYMGSLRDDISLRVLYSAADAFALPSRQDNLPLTSMEALSCGTPVAAFNTGGPPSMITHQRTGYLATPFDPVDFARGLRWILGQRDSLSIRHAAKSYAEHRFDPAKVAEEYRVVYSGIVS